MHKEFDDVLTNELPNELPLKREMDHEIELTLGMKLQNKASYRFNQAELAEFKCQLTGVLIRGYIRLSKSLFGVLVLFVSKKDSQI